MQSTKLEGAKQPSRRAGMSAANVGASININQINGILFSLSMNDKGMQRNVIVICSKQMLKRKTNNMLHTCCDVKEIKANLCILVPYYLPFISLWLFVLIISIRVYKARAPLSVELKYTLGIFVASLILCFYQNRYAATSCPGRKEVS